MENETPKYEYMYIAYQVCTVFVTSATVAHFRVDLYVLVRHLHLQLIVRAEETDRNK